MTDKPPMDIADHLIVHLQEEFGVVSLTYRSPPRIIEGGYDTRIYGFQLDGPPEELSGPLILRVFRKSGGVYRARFEAAVQNAVAKAGYPVPRVLHICTDMDILGGAFIIMEQLPGEPMRSALLSVLRALESEGVPRRNYSVEGLIAGLEERIERASLEGLRPGIQWSLENKPPEPERQAICHGDFHVMNVLVDGERVSGVLDWANAFVADPAFDVAITKVIMSLGKSNVPGPFRTWMMRHYYDAYVKLNPLDPDRVQYYEALRCLRALVGAREHILQEQGLLEADPRPYAWAEPRVVRGIIGRFRGVTGIELSLPSR